MVDFAVACHEGTMRSSRPLWRTVALDSHPFEVVQEVGVTNSPWQLR